MEPRSRPDTEERTENKFFRALSPRLRVSVVAFVLAIIAGCCPQKPAARTPYLGPTLPLTDVVERINQNNSRLKTLWASGDFECWVRDDKGQTQHFDGDNLILVYRKPGELRLVGQKVVVGRIFDVGSNHNQFWMWIPLDQVNTMWWGEYKNIDTMPEGAIPIRPDLLTEVLGVDDLDSDLLKAPIPAMRFNAEEDAYVIDFHVLLPDRMIVQKEVWYDRQTLLPRAVTFFDRSGRVVLRADLRDHKPLDEDPKAPKIATHFDLNFLQTGTKLVLNLRELKTSNKGKPDDIAFRFPGPDAAKTTYKVDQSPAQ